MRSFTIHPFAALPHVAAFLLATHARVSPDRAAHQSRFVARRPAAPCSANVFCPGDSLQAKVAAQPPGSTFRFTPGLYRGQSIAPKSGDVFLGSRDVILSGGAIITGWQRTGNAWTAPFSKQHVALRNHGKCDNDHPVCNEYEDLYVDDVLQRRVRTVGEVASGDWAYDYTTITLGTDPTGHRVELTAAPYAFRGTGETGFPKNVTIRGMVIEKYAGGEGGNEGGAIWTEKGADGWLIDSVETRYNHFAGIRFAGHARVRGSFTHDNALEGWSSYRSDSATIEGSESAHNNTDGYICTWNCGGGKMAETRWFTARNNYVHDNLGNGIWLDIDNRWCLIEGNRVIGNRNQGIFQEIGEDCVIRNNDVERNGVTRRGDDLGGAGILVVSSQDVEVAGNRVLDNGNGIGIREDNHRGHGIYGEWTTKNVWVHDNTVRLSVPGSLTGAGDLSGMGTIFSPGTVRFERNSYDMAGAGSSFTWKGARHSPAQWRGEGNDIGDSSLRASPPPR